MNDTVRNVLFNAVGVAVVAWVLWSKVKGRQRSTDDLSELARGLNMVQQSGALERVAADDRAALGSGKAGRARAALIEALPGARASYEGTVNGVRVTMALCAARHGTSSQTVLVEFTAHPPSPWTVGLAVAREHAMDHLLQPRRQAQDIRSDDAAFDRDVFVRADRPEAVTAMLRAKELRETIRALLTTQPRSWIDDDGVHVRLVRPSSAPATVLSLVQRMTALVGVLDEALS